MKKRRVFASALTISALTIGALLALNVLAPEHKRAANRIIEIRDARATNGMQAMMSDLRVTNDDHLLMVSDGMSAERNHTGVDFLQLSNGFWFAAADGFDKANAGYNYGSTSTDGGKTWKVDYFHRYMPKPEFQASAQEVAWNYIRLKQLRKQGVPFEKCVEIIAGEARRRPWETR